MPKARGGQGMSGEPEIAVALAQQCLVELPDWISARKWNHMIRSWRKAEDAEVERISVVFKSWTMLNSFQPLHSPLRFLCQSLVLPFQFRNPQDHDRETAPSKPTRWFKATKPRERIYKCLRRSNGYLLPFGTLSHKARTDHGIDQAAQFQSFRPGRRLCISTASRCLRCKGLGEARMSLMGVHG